ncbi:hypothetical protein KCP77_16930 [Salmonella enterica subsp. enterica]|nr:hypothetical protein KCP77_16930 [Salmonella enterica subsp. enterica]
MWRLPGRPVLFMQLMNISPDPQNIAQHPKNMNELPLIVHILFKEKFYPPVSLQKKRSE